MATLIDAQTVKALREETGLPVMKCKAALAASGGDKEKAKEILRKQGVAFAGIKSGRTTKEGSVGAYVHFNGRVGVLLELGCESDFVAKNDIFKALLKDLTMHVAFADPLAVDRNSVPAAAVEKAKVEYEGNLEKFYAEKCLLEQPFYKDDKLKVNDLLQQHVAKLGENIVLRRFSRMEVGQ
jgi:elongation factor Ts